jgi:hypothetical protein
MKLLSYPKPGIINEMQLACPKCHGVNVHLKTVVQSFREEELQSVTLDFWCENGCDFSHTIHTHEGETFVSVE